MSLRGSFLRLKPIFPCQLERSRSIIHTKCLSHSAIYLENKLEALQESHKSRLIKIQGLDERRFRKKFKTQDGKTIKLLTPVVLSARIKKLYERGQLQEAIDMVKHSPPDAQNAAVWATLINFVMSEKKYKEAYKLFTDMKRRGIRASIRTYGALLQGYAQIDDWTSHPAQLKNVHSIQDQLSRFVKTSGDEEELNIIPFNSLIKIYGKAEEYQKMYDVYHLLDKKGPLAPDMYTFTILLNAIASRTKLNLETEPPEFFDSTRDTWSNSDNHPTQLEDKTADDPTAVAYRNASDARLIWRDLLRTCGTPDSYAIRAMLVLLAKGRPSDRNLAIDICHEFLGLAPPGEKAKRSSIPIHRQTLNLLLSICNNSDRPRHTVHYVQQLIDSKRVENLATEHMNLALEARATLASSDHQRDHALRAFGILEWMLHMSVIPKSGVDEGGLGAQIKPLRDTHDLVALICFYAGDWATLSQTFELLSGYNVTEIAANTARASSERPRFEPSGSFMACMLRTAVDSENRHGNTLAVLSAMRYFRRPLSQLFSRSSLTQREKSENSIHVARLAGAISATAPVIKELTVTKPSDLKENSLFWLSKALEYEKSKLRSQKKPERP